MLSSLSSFKLTTFLMAVLVALMLAGAWIPQTVDHQELFARLGTAASTVETLGLNTIVSSTMFLFVIVMLFVNLLACTVSRFRRRMLCRLSRWQTMDAQQIMQLSSVAHVRIDDIQSARALIVDALTKRRFSYLESLGSLVFEKGRLGFLAGPVTHLGLFLLLAGVGITALFGYSGYVSGSHGEALIPVPKTTGLFAREAPVEQLIIKRSWRENYPGGEPKQWYSELEVKDNTGRIAGSGITSVNAPLSIAGVDFYQADWQVISVRILIGDKTLEMPLQSMGNSRVGMVDLLADIQLVAVTEQDGSSLHLYAGDVGHRSLRLLAVLKPGTSFAIDPFKVTYVEPVISTTLQYKFDPGLPLVYTSFAFLLTGACLVAVPRCRIYGASLPGSPASWVFGWEPTPFQSLAEDELSKLQDLLSEPRKAGATANER